MTRLPRSTALLIAALILIVVMPAFAGDPPDRVLRLKYMSGQVSFQPGGVDDWVAAAINRPLTTADRVWTDKDSRAELTLATAALRMDSETSLTISNLSDNTVQLELDQGVLNVHVQRMYNGEIYEVDTPNVAFTLLKPGDYRFEVDAIADTTNVIVRRGKGEGNGNGRGVEVKTGEMARFEHGNSLMHTMAQAPRPDGFDDWCEVRDKREDNAESVQYVSNDVIGYEDLDQYGYWQPVPTYGYVWYPRGVVVGWAPYRYGHWAWIAPWGWTWVDDAPWGFAPFHYGRWVYTSYGWGWCPGPRHYRPIYAPALVAWFGGSNWGVGLSFGGPAVGWVPLGWGEPYYPYYRVSRGYFRNVNVYNTHITNITVIENNYYNRRGHEFENVHYVNQQHGFSAVNTGVLEHGRPVARDLVRVSDNDFRCGHFMRSADVAPTRAAVLGGRENVPAAIPPRGAMNRPVVSKMTPPARPAKFEDRVAPENRNPGAAGREANVREDHRPAATPGNGMSVTPAEAARPSNADVHRPPVGDRPGNPAANRSMDASNGQGNPAGHIVPRPPERSPRVINLEGNPSENDHGRSVASPNAPANEHYVPRPPERQRVTVDAQGNSRQDNGTPSPEMRRGSSEANPPQNGRSPVFDRNNSSDQADSATPRNEPRPSENNSVRNENRAPANGERPAADRNASPHNQPAAERQNHPARTGERAPKTERSVPRPSESKPAQSDAAKRSSLRPYPSPYSESGTYSVRPASFSPRQDSPRQGFTSARTSSFSPRSGSYSSRNENNIRTDRPAYSRPASSYAPSYSRSYSSPRYSQSEAPRAAYSRPYSAPRSYAGGRTYGTGRSYARSSGGGGGSYGGGASHAAPSSGGSAGRRH
jgi:Family of unknown function (DUF6600)/FecR protein